MLFVLGKNGNTKKGLRKYWMKLLVFNEKMPVPISLILIGTGIKLNLLFLLMM